MRGPIFISWLKAAALLAITVLQLFGFQLSLAAQTASQRIDAQAVGTFVDLRTAGPATLQSNIVSAMSRLVPPSITFFTNDSYQSRAWNTSAGGMLYLQITASACNQNTAVAESIVVTLTSTMTHSVQQYTALETGPSTGVFRVGSGIPTQDMKTGDERAAGLWQGVVAGGAVDASFSGCGGLQLATQLQIDPGGVVFDSATGLPVAGATVRLIDVAGSGNGGSPGSAATVFDYDGVTPAPSEVVTGSDGRYAFPKVGPSVYRLGVSPPVLYSFPSTAKPAQFPASRTVTPTGSYGGTFPVNASTGAVLLDVPVDSVPHGLSVQMTASRTTAEIAETVEYLLTVKNVGQVTLPAVRVNGSLPVGFAYVAGSARMDGAAIADPSGGSGPALAFMAGSMEAGSTRLLRYRLRLGAGALHGDGIHRAQARNESPALTISNVASARVKVDSGVFSDKALVLGTVFADCNGNGVQDAGEPGAPGVRLYLEDGSFVVTDGAGRFSFYGISPRTHVLKIDASSLPEGAETVAISSRHAGDGNSRFVDARPGELQRADFALRGCSPALAQALRARRAALGEHELGTSLKTELKVGAVASLGDLRSLPAQGLIGETAGASPASPAASGRSPAKTSHAELETIAAPIDNELGFIEPADGDVVSRTLPSLRIKGHKGAVIALAVNGIAVGDDRVGQRVVAEDKQAELRDYVGVTLQRGENTLTLTESDGFGHVRASRSIHLIVAGELARLVVTPAVPRADADGRTLVPVRIEAFDAHGHAVLERIELTLQTSTGQWNERDLDTHQPGVQTAMEGGTASFDLMAPAGPGDARLQVTAAAAKRDAAVGDSINGEAMVAFGPVLRPMLAVGVVEGAFNLRKLDARSVVPARSDDGFEDQLQQFAGSDSSGLGARAALFLKGKVRGDYLLTLGYDSAKATGGGLFRDIQPDAFYPVYGDSSVRGFDAQSTGKLYVRVEKDKSYLLYGDFTTQSVNPARQLGAYQRSLSGLKEHYENDSINANAFASHDSTRQTIDELHANGTSGPFMLGSADMVENSEKVEILVRDRNQPSLIVKTTTLARFTDYDIDALTGRLLLRAPVPSLDADLNPVSIRITYENDQGGAKFWVAGVDGQVKLTDHVEVGGSYVQDFNPLATFKLASVNSTVRISDETQVIGEAARVGRSDEGVGNAERVELQHNGTALKARVYASRSDVGFDNPSATITKGRSEGGAKFGYALDERTRVTGEALHTGDLTTGSHRDGALIGLERSFDGGTKVEVGARRVHDDPAVAGQATTDTTSVRAKVTTTVPGLPAATAFVEAEQDVHDSNKRLVALGGDYQIANGGRVYLRHELISSLTGPYALDPAQKRNTTVLGVDADYMQDGRVFSEYRGRESFDGRGTEAAIGLRNRWALAEGLRLNTSFERVQTLSGSTNATASAVTAALEYTANPLWKATGRIELRDGLTNRGALSTVGIARKLDADWTFLGKNVFAVTQDKAAQPTHVQERLQLGMAYRDSTSNRVNALARYEFKQERGSTGDEGSRSVHTLSAHADYQPVRTWTLNGHVAAKWVDESLDGAPSRSNAQLIGARVTHEIGNDWDVGVSANVLATDTLKSRQTGMGAEAGYQVRTNLWVSAGYNVTGFKDRDLSAENYTSRGVYVRLRFKFDENLLSRAPT